MDQGNAEESVRGRGHSRGRGGWPGEFSRGRGFGGRGPMDDMSIGFGAPRRGGWGRELEDQRRGGWNRGRGRGGGPFAWGGDSANHGAAQAGSPPQVAQQSYEQVFGRPHWENTPPAPAVPEGIPPPQVPASPLASTQPTPPAATPTATTTTPSLPATVANTSPVPPGDTIYNLSFSLHIDTLSFRRTVVVNSKKMADTVYKTFRSWKS